MPVNVAFAGRVPNQVPTPAPARTMTTAPTIHHFLDLPDFTPFATWTSSSLAWPSPPSDLTESREHGADLGFLFTIPPLEDKDLINPNWGSSKNRRHSQHARVARPEAV
jgi:hypothetical protein